MNQRKAHTGISRRRFLLTGTAGLGATALGALTRPAFAQAPSVLKGSRLSILQGTYFVPQAQDLYKRQAEEWGRENGVTVAADFLNWPDLQPKISAAVLAGGVDIVELYGTWNYLYQSNLVDLTEEADEFAKRGGGFEPYVLNSARVGDRYLGIPQGNPNGGVCYRIGWFKEANVANAEDGTKIDLTWEEYHAIGKKLKAQGHPFGQALGHSSSDPHAFCYPYMWSHGAMEVDKDGKTVLFNKPEFVDAMSRFIQAWKDAYDETGTSWDDSGNNRAFLAGHLSATYNGSSIYSAAKANQPAVANDMHHMLIPRGPAGRFYWLGSRTFGILKSSKNIPAAREFLRWWFQDKQFDAWWAIQEGYMLPPTARLEKHAMWDKDPKMAPFRLTPKYGRDLGWAGPPNQKAALAFAKFIVVDTYAKALQSGNPKAAIEWGAEELKRVYGS
jgi:multiple sugar transport system substrate-binding protein